MAHVSHRLSNSFEGALAGGGDPATSPLYVFGPFLQLIVVAGVAQITFGASVWLVVLTVVVVSFMYRQVIRWVTDGTGGSGLTEEEFGAWAVKVNAGITFVEYTLTFLVSVAALVTLLSDRYPSLDQSFHGFSYRILLAVLLSLLIGWLAPWPVFPSRKAMMPNSPEALVAHRSSPRLFAICWASSQSSFSAR